MIFYDGRIVIIFMCHDMTTVRLFVCMFVGLFVSVWNVNTPVPNNIQPVGKVRVKIFISDVSVILLARIDDNIF